MTFSSLLGSLIVPQINKAATWLADQTEGIKKGTAIVNSPAGQLIVKTVAASVEQKQTTNDALANKLGIPTTEQGIIAVIGQVVQAHPTLDFSQKDALISFLESKL